MIPGAAALLRRLVGERTLDPGPRLAFDRGADGGLAARWDGALVCRIAGSASTGPDRPDALFVVGAGPSMKSQHLQRLPQDACILCNGAISLIASHGLKPHAVFIEDARFVAARPDLVAAMPEGTPCYFSAYVITALCALDPALLGRWHVHLIDYLNRPLRIDGADDRASRRLVVSGARKGVRFSLATQAGFASCGTVAYSACQLAVERRPQRIGLVGLDFSGFEQPRFHETANQVAVNKLAKAMPMILPSFVLFGTVCRALGIDVRNHSPASAIDQSAIPYDDFLDRAPV
jgi:hypothetical protein